MPDKCYVVGLGNCTMDYLGHVPRIIKGGEKGVITRVVEQPGGIMANCLTQLARLGIKTEWIGIIGDDLHGEKILNYFKNDNIITDNIIISKGEFSSYCWILVAPDGDRAGYVIPNITPTIKPEDIESNYRDIISAADILAVEVSQFPINSVLSSVKIAKEVGTMVVLDFDSPPNRETEMYGTKEEVTRVVVNSDVVAGSFIAISEYAGTDNLDLIAQKLFDSGVKLVGITLGAEGCYLANQERSIKVPGINVKVIDTTGAGDAFHGGLIYGLINKMSLEEIGKFANACGALCCKELGARASKDLKTIHSFMND